MKDNICALINKAVNPSTSKAIAERCEKQAEEAISAQTTHEAELAKIEAILANLSSMQTKFATKAEQLTIEEVFTSSEVSRDIINLFIETIEINDKKDYITINFNKNEEI